MPALKILTGKEYETNHKIISNMHLSLPNSFVVIDELKLSLEPAGDIFILNIF